MINDGRYTYTYDANGNMTGRSDGRIIIWDYDNQVISISDGGSFVYNSARQRIKKIENGVTTLYFCIGLKLEENLILIPENKSGFMVYAGAYQ